MDSGSRMQVLAAYDVRRRVARGGGGSIHLFWGSLSVEMSHDGFVGFARLVAEAAERPVRCGELAKDCCGRVARCAMGEIMVRHDRLTLWLSPEEFEELYRLASAARQRLADSEPPPALGVPWTPREELPSIN